MKIAVMASIVVVALLAGAGAIMGYRATRSQEVFVAKVNGQTISASDWEKAQTAVARAQIYHPGLTASLPRLVEDLLLQQESDRRGTSCSTKEAAQQLAQNVASFAASGSQEVLLQSAELTGDAPPGYSTTPDAQRTPAAADVLATYQSDPAVVEEFRKSCSVGRLYDSLTTTGNVADRDAAATALKESLIQSANIEYATDISSSTSASSP